MAYTATGGDLGAYSVHVSCIGRHLTMSRVFLCVHVYRYYVADGVRNTAQDTWHAVMGSGGRAAVARLIDLVSECQHERVRECD